MDQFLRLYIIVALIAFSTALKPFLGLDNRNFLLIGFMAISLPLAIARKPSLTDMFLYFYMITIIVFPVMMNEDRLRWSTVIYSLLFCSAFLAYETALSRSKMGIEMFIKAVRFLFLAYLVTFLIQQFCVLTGLPILNASNYIETSKWKLNSLSAEASHSARIISLLMFSYLTLQEIARGEKYSWKLRLREDGVLWLGYIWLSLTMQSATAILLTPIVLFKAINMRNLGSVFGVTAVSLVAFTLTSDDMWNRAVTFVDAASTLDYSSLLEADHSGSMRIAPLFVLAGLVDVFSWQGMFGNGIDSVSTFMSDYIYGVGREYTGGGMLQVWYEYGFITFILFTIFTLRASSALRSITNFVLWLFIVFLSGPNNQILWLHLILFASVAHFRNSSAAALSAHHPNVFR